MIETRFRWSWDPGLKCYRLAGGPDNLLCGFTTRCTDLARLRSELGIARIARLHQIHSDRVFYIRELKTGLEGDGLFTDRAGLYLSVEVADCLPIYFFGSNPSSGSNPTSVGICHAGWRGTAAGIARRMVELMECQSGCRTRELRYAFGPCIGPCCYEVGEELPQRFNWISGFEEEIIRRRGRLYLDLKGMNRRILARTRVEEVASLELCTSCRSDLFYSARRDGVTGRNLGVVGF